MTRKKRTPEEIERRAKIRELLQVSNISSMVDIQNLFKETIAEFMENSLDAELDDELGYSTTIKPVRRTFPNSTIHIVSNTWKGSFFAPAVRGSRGGTLPHACFSCFVLFASSKENEVASAIPASQ